MYGTSNLEKTTKTPKSPTFKMPRKKMGLRVHRQGGHILGEMLVVFLLTFVGVGAWRIALHEPAPRTVCLGDKVYAIGKGHTKYLEAVYLSDGKTHKACLHGK